AAVDRAHANSYVAPRSGLTCRDMEIRAVVPVVAADRDALVGKSAEGLPAIEALLEFGDPGGATSLRGKTCVHRGEKVAGDRVPTGNVRDIRCAIRYEAPSQGLRAAVLAIATINAGRPSDDEVEARLGLVSVNLRADLFHVLDRSAGGEAHR